MCSLEHYVLPREFSQNPLETLLNVVEERWYFANEKHLRCLNFPLDLFLTSMQYTARIIILGKNQLTNSRGDQSSWELSVLSKDFIWTGFIFQTLQMDVNKLNITLLRIFRQGVAAALGLLPQQVHINRLIVSTKGLCTIKCIRLLWILLNLFSCHYGKVQ